MSAAPDNHYPSAGESAVMLKFLQYQQAVKEGDLAKQGRAWCEYIEAIERSMKHEAD